jgi:exosortase O
MTSERIIDRNTIAEWFDWRSFGSIALVLSWFYFQRSPLIWLGQAIQNAALFNQMLLGMGGVLLLVQGIRYRRQLQLSSVPEFRWVPLALMLGCAIGTIVLRWLIQFEPLPVLLFVLGTYGLLGLFLQTQVWRQGLAVAIAIAVVLPFGTQFNQGLGFPIRTVTAHTVEQILQGWNIAALSSENIIVLENSIANVDLPCSGTKSLWTGMVFLLAATWLEGRQMGMRWLLICVVNFVLLVLANIGRVLALVLLTQVFHQPAIADLLHLPLGLAGFVTACLVSLVLLKQLPKQGLFRDIEHSRSMPSPSRFKTGIVQITLIVCVLGLSFLPQPQVATPTLSHFADLNLASIQTKSLPLAPVEHDFFATYPDTVAQKYRFEAEGISGSVLLVTSATWRSQHTPELCLVGLGFAVDKMEAKPLTAEVWGRWLSLNQGKYAAAYWFQSSQRTTGDYLSRMWGEINRQEPTWVMASVLFDQPQTIENNRVRLFLNEVHDAVAQHIQAT